MRRMKGYTHQSNMLYILVVYVDIEINEKATQVNPLITFYGSVMSNLTPHVFLEMEVLKVYTFRKRNKFFIKLYAA